MIVRVFKAIIFSDKQDEFKSFFTKIALPLIKKQEGVIDTVIGLPIDNSSQEFMMISYWRDIESLKKFAGVDWRNAVIDDREKHLIKSVTIDHFMKFE
ncbi:antibiotic biosynthesis monooxygenase [Tenacibaculum caenipelagi]|uniref:Antibiotic biosynthesis monooxygenase n=1 Tax=Tenacibaculum caenipelagi TaxID=1325435 RepID=A0A4R6TF11_9FLAO|nr:antibiotic biosynthesis monooxygenase [Tenacibaculum caenipelagi]TDQ25716.1 antibiotic biosynthesis monooxygenase [Tenacibaculum caenipelagi]